MTVPTAPTLAEFLLARIADDEAAARAATSGPWHSVGQGRDATVVDVQGRPVLDAGGEFCGDLWLDAYDADLTHIARHDPAQVLAGCAAKRQIVELMLGYPERDVEHWTLHDAVQLLALPHADHPDYDESWRP